MKQILQLLLLILIGCSNPEPKDIKILNLDDNYYYYLDTKYSGVFYDRSNSDFYYEGQMSKGKYHGYFKKFDFEDNLISETTFVNGFNTGPLVFYAKDGVSSVFDGELEKIEQRNSKIKYEADSDWEDFGAGEIIDPLSSDYFYKMKIDYLKNKITNSVKISTSEDNLYFGFYEPNVWIEERYDHFSINDFIIVVENETLSEQYVDYLYKIDLKDFEESKSTTLNFLNERKKKYIDEDNGLMVEIYEERIAKTISETFEDYRKENNTIGYQTQNNKFDKIFYEIQLLDKDKFLFTVKIFRDGYQSYEVEQIWEKRRIE